MGQIRQMGQIGQIGQIGQMGQSQHHGPGRGGSRGSSVRARGGDGGHSDARWLDNDGVTPFADSGTGTAQQTQCGSSGASRPAPTPAFLIDAHAAVRVPGNDAAAGI